MTDAPKRKIGRPPTGKGQNGEPERVQDYPKLAVSVRPTIRAKLNAMARLENRSAWLIVEDAILLYAGSLQPRDKKLLDALIGRKGGGLSPRDLGQ